MEEQYVKDSLVLDSSEFEKEDEIIKNIVKTKRELEVARTNFEYAKNNDLLDYYIYQIKANQSKIDYLIKLAKTKGIMVNFINKIEIKIQDNVG